MIAELTGVILRDEVDITVQFLLRLLLSVLVQLHMNENPKTE